MATMKMWTDTMSQMAVGGPTASRAWLDQMMAMGAPWWGAGASLAPRVSYEVSSTAPAEVSATLDPMAYFTTLSVEALKPAFTRLLAATDWLPDRFAQPDAASRMGDGIGQYALYRAEDGSLCLFALVVPPNAATPVHDHLAWGLVGMYRGTQHAAGRHFLSSTIS